MSKPKKAGGARRRSFLRALAGVCMFTALPASARLRLACKAGEASAFYAYARTSSVLLYEAQLDAITGGTEIEAFIARQSRETVTRLREISAAIERAHGA